MIRTVQIGDDEIPTLDNYETELNLDEVPDDDLWADEDTVQLNEVPDALWCDMLLDKPPPPPEAWVDKVADELEIACLLSMGVLQKVVNPADDVDETLTTRFVYDWRFKERKPGVKMRMRRSRFVAREFASIRRYDTYSPATGSHTSNVIPLVFLKNG
eukprot:s126_g31.t1